VKKWPKEEENALLAILQDESHKMSVEEIAKIFNKSKASIAHKADRLGFKNVGRAKLNKYPEENIEKMLLMASEGESLEKISELTGIKLYFVRAYLSKGKGKQKPKNWAEEEIQWVKDNLQELGAKRCAKHFKISPKQIYKLKKDLGIRIRKKRPSRAKLLDEKSICSYYLEVYNVRLVAEKFETYNNRVAKILRSNNIEIKQICESDKHLEEMTKDYLEDILSTEQIGEKYGYSGDVIREKMKKCGVYNKDRAKKFLNKVAPYQHAVNKYGKEIADQLKEKWSKEHGRRSTGENNPMYNKPSPQGAGNGWKGWFEGHYFRSLRELCFMIKMKVEGTEWISAESKKYSIPYEFLGIKRTYRPDFLIGNALYEIKPTKLHKSPNILAKTEAALKFCEERRMEYVLTDVKIDTDSMINAYKQGWIKFDRKYEEKFVAYIAKLNKTLS